MTIRPIKTMMNHATTEIFLDGASRCPTDALVGEEGKGFRYILDGMNAERILIAAECIGDGRWFIGEGDGVRLASASSSAARSAQNQGVQFPIAHAHAALEAADLMRYKAAWLFEQGLPVRAGGEHGQATRRPRRPGRRRTPASTRTAASASPRSTTSSASSARTGSTSIAPVRNNLVLAYVGQHVLGMPRSY